MIALMSSCGDTGTIVSELTTNGVSTVAAGSPHDARGAPLSKDHQQPQPARSWHTQGWRSLDRLPDVCAVEAADVDYPEFASFAPELGVMAADGLCRRGRHCCRERGLRI